MDERSRAREAVGPARLNLVHAVEELGYPQEFGHVLADELVSGRAMRRMASYLRLAHPDSPEQIADEMLAIVAEQRRWVERKVSVRAQARMTAFYNRLGGNG